MSLNNFYSLIKQKAIVNPHYESHKITLPFRMLICTASGGGKSNFALNLIHLMSNTFTKIIICTREPEPLYQHLESQLNSKNQQNVFIHYGNGDIPNFTKMNKGENGLIIYDDLVLSKNNAISEMFIRGRKLGFSSIYISQSYFATPKLIRQNVNYVSLGRGITKRDLRLILSDFPIPLSIDQLERYYNDITRNAMSFILLDFVGRNLRHNIQDILFEFDNKPTLSSE